MKRFLALLVLLVSGCLMTKPSEPLETVSKVDLSRYVGKWHEIARFPARFQEGCRDSSAEYTLLADGRIRVLNQCLRDGNIAAAEGKAKVLDESGAKLKVSFFWPFYGDYWIVELGENYEYSVVSEPTRKYLWILSRSPEMGKEVLEPILERLRRKGYDTSRLIFNRNP